MSQAASPRTPRPNASTTTKSSPSARPRRRSRAPKIPTTNTGVFVAIGLGGNTGNPRRAFRLVTQTLIPFLGNPRMSPIYRTSPVGGPPQREFLNAVLVGTTDLGPSALLSLLKQIELRAGREPGGPRNAP